jgi:hypothetical protein
MADSQFPDAWYELNHPETARTRAADAGRAPLGAEDFPPHVQDLRVEQASPSSSSQA